ncbi:MAG: histidine kinase [Bacteroidales bacterium]|nr:histidine kinase [Bacteroidales bacterium]
MHRSFTNNFLFLIFILTLTAGTDVIVKGQSFTIRKFTNDNGLPHNNIRSIVRDSTGFLWIGSWDGLSRFDGHEFRNYFHEPDDSASLPYFSIYNLKVDCNNKLWILTDTRDLTLYNRSEDNFSVIRNFRGIRFDSINNISTDHSGKLVVLRNSMIIIGDPSAEDVRVIRLTFPGGKVFRQGSDYKFLTMCNDSVIFLSGTNSVTEFRKITSDNYEMTGDYPINENIVKPAVYFDISIWRDLYISPAGNKWLLSDNGLFLFDRDKKRYSLFAGQPPVEEFTGRKSFLWAKRNEGVFYYSASGGKLINIPYSRSDWAHTMLSEREDLFWFSSITSKGVAMGFSMVSVIPGYFRNNLISSPDSTTPALYSVIQDKDNNIWAGVRGFNHISKISSDGSVSFTGKITAETGSRTGYIRTMIPVRDGIWIGYHWELLEYYDYRTGTFTRHRPEIKGFRAMAADPDGNLLIGCDGRLIRYYPSTRKSVLLWSSKEPYSVFRIYVDDSGTLWAGLSYSRVLKYNLENGDHSIIKVAPGITNVEDIISGSHGELWFALLGKGVCRYNTADSTFTYYTTARGLSNNTTYSLLMDSSGKIWVSTNNGISRIDPDNDHIRTFDQSDGLGISEFNSGAAFVSSSGQFFLGGMGGYVRFHPDSIAKAGKNIRRNSIILTGLEVSGEQKHLACPVSDADTIILARGENNFHISFSTTDFVNADKTIFRYRIDETDNRWMVTGRNNRNINYSNLKPGWHKLTIEATDVNGEWTTSRDIGIRIIASFYQTKGFRIIGPVIILLIMVFSVLLYIRQIRQEERSKQDELKLQSLRGQMNPHFIFNSLNSINYFISNNDSLSANRYIADFSRLIRSILANMDRGYIPFENELVSIRDYLRIEHLRFGDKFDYNIDTEKLDNTGEIEICPGIVQPFIENAIWHGVRPLENKKGMIEIKFMPQDDERIRCVIEDDGIGLSASACRKEENVKHVPKGITMIRERLNITGKLKRVNYGLNISNLFNDRKETGTRVEVEIPAKRIKTRQS